MQYSQEHLKTMVYAEFGGTNRVYHEQLENRELKRYVSQNISSNSWNSTVNKVGVLAKFVFSQALLYFFD